MLASFQLLVAPAQVRVFTPKLQFRLCPRSLLVAAVTVEALVLASLSCTWTYVTEADPDAAIFSPHRVGLLLLRRLVRVPGPPVTQNNPLMVCVFPDANWTVLPATLEGTVRL